MTELPSIFTSSGKEERSALVLPIQTTGLKDTIGYALYIAQRGGKHADAKPLRGFGGPGIVEIVEDHAGGTYRAVYTVRLAGRIYVLHVFQKKSKSGIKTPKPEIELIKSRLKRAEEEHARWLEARKE
jgi:phage-related protein